jgi:hypothetical protein
MNFTIYSMLFLEDKPKIEGQAHAARQETTTLRALRDLGARRPIRAFSRGGGRNENHSEGRMRG